MPAAPRTSLEPAHNLCSHGRNDSHAGQSACLTSTLNPHFIKEKIMSKVSHIPEGFNTITPYLIVKDAAQAIEYYKKVFGATEVVRMDQPGGKIGHAELQLGNSRIMLADENPNMAQGQASATSIGA